MEKKKQVKERTTEYDNEGDCNQRKCRVGVKKENEKMGEKLVLRQKLFFFVRHSQDMQSDGIMMAK